MNFDDETIVTKEIAIAMGAAFHSSMDLVCDLYKLGDLDIRFYRSPVCVSVHMRSLHLMNNPTRGRLLAFLFALGHEVKV